ncbi:MAG TPA: hypothetical protein VF021_04830 [Longimicrobiales bacterium]
MSEPTLNDIARWVPPLVFAIITLVLFREFVFGGRLLGVDTQALSYFARHFYQTFLTTFHRFPLWDPLLYGGLPFVDGMHGDIFYPPSLALFFLGTERFWGWKMLLHVFLAGLFCYLWLRELGVSRGSAMLGGIIFMMGADLVSLVYPGGDGKLFVSALAPLAFLLTERAARLGRVRDFAALSLGIALMILTSHMQCAYFAIWGITLYFSFRFVQNWRAKQRVGTRALAGAALFMAAGLLAAAATAIQIVPPLEYLREWSHRASKTEQAQIQDAYAYSTSYSLHAEEAMSLVVPEFVGDNVQTETRSGTTYWGKNGFKINSEYAGLLGLLLLPVLFVRRRRGITWFFTGLALLTLLYALGASTPFFHLFYLIPGVKLFRAPSIIIFLFGLSVATLGALAFDRIAEAGKAPTGDDMPIRRALWIVTGALGVLALLASSGVLISIWTSIFSPDLPQQQAAALGSNLGNIKLGCWIAFLVALVVTGAIEGYLRAMWSVRAALIALCVIAFVEQYRVDWPFLHATRLMNDASDPTLFTPDESIQYLQQRQAAGEIFRAFDLSSVVPQLQGQGYGSNTLAVHGIEQLAGHHGNEMGRYRELIGGPEPINLGRNISLLDLTNTEYIVSPQPVNLPGYSEVYRGSRSVVLRKADVLPRAYLVGRVEVVPDEKAVDRLLAQDFDYRKSALLPAQLPAGVLLQADPQGSVQWVERGANRQTLRVRTDRPALLMVLDNYYKSWHVHVDHRTAPLLRANYTFRAVPLAAGEHEVTFMYLAASLHTPAMLSALTLIVLLVIAFGSPLVDRLRARNAAA